MKQYLFDDSIIPIHSERGNYHQLMMQLFTIFYDHNLVSDKNNLLLYDKPLSSIKYDNLRTSSYYNLFTIFN